MTERPEFERLALAHMDAAYNLAFWLLRNRPDAEDAVQDAYLRAYRGFSNFQGDNIRPWLLKIVRNVAFRKLGNHRRGSNVIDLSAGHSADCIGRSPTRIPGRNRNRDCVALDSSDVVPLPQPGEWPGAACYCGRTGCVETFLSGPGLARDHREATGEDLDAAAIAARALEGDEGCAATLDRYEERLARALAAVVNLLDPDVIVLGGGLSNLARLYERVPTRWSAWVFSDRVDTPLRPPRHRQA